MSDVIERIKKRILDYYGKMLDGKRKISCNDFMLYILKCFDEESAKEPQECDSDCISRKKLMEEIKKKSSGYLSEWDTAGILNAINNQPQVQLINQWIPCSERLPEEHEEPKDIYDPFTLAIEDTQYIMTSNLVLVTVLDLEKESIFVLDDCTVGGKWCNKADTWEIIAWQPLPEPYKKEV